MSAPQKSGPGLAALENELVCSICTELLYQPQTLLDCLHTFCGSCLKEWFSAQGSRRPSSSSRFTCPSCRAAVRGTRPNATVTTLLDMVLAAHPERVRSATEKEEIARRYNPSESVLPVASAGNESAEEDDEDDRRLLEEVREMSLREARGDNRRTRHSSRTRDRSNNAPRQADESRARRRRDEESSARHQTEQRSARSETQTHDSAERTRRVEHQSSLRSLLSLSSDAETMEEEILRQIIEDGLLDDIDLDNLGTAQEEELSERIADAYRRRHLQRAHSRQGQRRQSPERPQTQSRSQSAQRETLPNTREHNDRRPPVSRPHLFEAGTRPTHAQPRRNSDQASGRHRTSPVPSNQASVSGDTLRPAVRSSSDMTAERTRNSQTGRIRPDVSSARARRATEAEQNISDVWISGGRERGERGSSRRITNQAATDSPTPVSPPLNGGASHSSTPTDQSAPALSSPLVPSRGDAGARNGRSRASSSRPTVPPSPSALFAEPSISCDRCGKTNIQYDLHKRCKACKEGKYYLCLRCYRLGQGCQQWAGFGASALATFEPILGSSNQDDQLSENRHVLLSLKYKRPPDTAYRTITDDRQKTSDNPARRLQTGLFCDICQSSASDCFWKCNQCNDGDWGFCNTCVNQSRCCTHALLPIRHMANLGRTDTTPSTSTPGDGDSFKILSFSTKCDICTYPIPASVTRFHCLECNSGDYDVCKNCYLKLVATSKIGKENGHNGWRRCLAGHRMIIVGFEDDAKGQRRVIVRDLVGGRALRDEHVARSPSASSPSIGGAPFASPELGSGDWSWKDGSERRKKASRLRGALTSTSSQNNSSSASDPHPASPPQPPPQQQQQPRNIPPFRRFPPDGGVGLIVHALWAWYPEDAIEDELVFPRGADITETENINDDWFWGCYAGRTGLFPGAHVTVVGEVQ